jgi:CubicO group peptidase (beta-lactamase class C family)
MGGIANARSLAGMYRALAIGGDGLVGPDEVAGMSSTMAAGLDATMLVPTRWSTGFVKSIDNSHLGPGDRDGCVMSENAFGYVGMGGSMGFADPGAYLSFGYTMNRQGMTTGLDARAQSLIDATYRALGYVRGDRGSWRP